MLFVFVSEDGKKDAVDAGGVGEDAHRAGSSSHLAESTLDSVGRASPAPPVGALEDEVRKELVKVDSQATDGVRGCQKLCVT